MAKYFGTDGFRGEAGIVLRADHAYKIGRFLGWYYKKKDKRARIVIGKDTRLSSYMFEYSIVSGLTASGADAYILHVTTTPSVSYVTASEGFDCGVMISASHNPYTDNGIKLVNGRGEKMEDSVLQLIEQYIDGEYVLPDGERCEKDIPFASGENIGCIVDYAAGRNRYIGYLISLSHYSLRDFNIGLDCANGSAWMIAKSVFDALGARTHVINASPDGLNINRGAGSTHIEALCRFVRDNHLDLGFAFDGDADRCIAVDENGDVVNGDHIMYLLAVQMKERGELQNNTVVTTVMSNLGLYKALEAAGIGYVQTAVGDKYVYENMVETGNCIGGEQSGHVILSKYATTGDGILTSIKVMEAVIATKSPLSKLAAPVRMYPQITENVRVVDKNAVTENHEIAALIDEISKELGQNGRILLRKSGTEPVVRVMVEAPTKRECAYYAEQVLDRIRKLELGGC